MNHSRFSLRVFIELAVIVLFKVAVTPRRHDSVNPVALRCFITLASIKTWTYSISTLEYYHAASYN